MMMKLLALLVLGPYYIVLQHESSELPDGDEAAFLHYIKQQDPGDARRVPSSAACLPSL